MEFGKNFVKSYNLQVLCARQSHNEAIMLILDDTCKRKLDENNLYKRELRVICNYYCCKHVAYGRYSCQDNVFFCVPPGQKASSSVPGSCPLQDAGRLKEQF